MVIAALAKCSMSLHLAVIWYSLHYTTVVTMLLRVFLRADLVPVRMVGV